jgi:mannose/fructose/N-acetylgalactosamine-specific phosphotransferase system component IIB
MDIALVRVDNRLVHGQILEAWVPFIKSSAIIVVDDQVASDFFRETVIKMAVPREVEVIVSNVEDFANNYKYGTGQGKKAIVLFSVIADALRAFQNGFVFDKLNIGNVYSEECLKQCSPSVMLDGEDIKTIRIFLDAGVNIDVRRVPREKPIDIRKLITMIGA